MGDGSHSIAQEGFKLQISLPQLPKCCNYKLVPPYPTNTDLKANLILNIIQAHAYKLCGFLYDINGLASSLKNKNRNECLTKFENSSRCMERV